MAKSRNTWSVLGKAQIIPGTPIRVVVKRCDQTGEFGVSVGEGSSRDKWLGMSSLDPASIKPELEGKLRRAEAEVESFRDLLEHCQGIAEIVGQVAKALRPASPTIDTNRAIAAARAALVKADGTLPGAGEAPVIALAESFMRGFQQTAVAK